MSSTLVVIGALIVNIFSFFVFSFFQMEGGITHF